MVVIDVPLVLHHVDHELGGRDEVRYAVQNSGTRLASKHRELNFSTGLLAAVDVANNRVTITNTLDTIGELTGTAWRVFYTNGSGVMVELALGASGTYLKSNGAAAAPTFEAPVDPTPFMITPASRLSIGTELAALGAGVPAPATWPAANRAIYIPFVLAESVTVVKLFWVNGATVSGNVDVGIYGGVSQTRLVSSGTTAQAGVNDVQSVDVTDTAMGPGQFYLALVCDNTTATFQRWPTATLNLKVAGAAQQASAFVLPTSAVLAATTAAYLPVFGLSLRTTPV